MKLKKTLSSDLNKGIIQILFIFTFVCHSSFLRAESASFNRTVYWAMETIFSILNTDISALGSDIIVYNPSTVLQRVTVNHNVAYIQSAAPSVTRTQAIRVYGSITVDGSQGFVIANGSQWSINGGGHKYSAPFTINSARPF
ncbi:MAG: hypothetical protein EBR01_07810 [Proteobacteria bacterium]|nr:hypothetical protein [Pseudomonadota bacterium]